VSRSAGLIGLLILAILAIVAVTGLTTRVRVEPAPAGSTSGPTAAAPTAADAGSLDSLLDAIRVEHGIKHGR